MSITASFLLPSIEKKVRGPGYNTPQRGVTPEHHVPKTVGGAALRNNRIEIMRFSFDHVIAKKQEVPPTYPETYPDWPANAMDEARRERRENLSRASCAVVFTAMRTMIHL